MPAVTHSRRIANSAGEIWGTSFTPLTPTLSPVGERGVFLVRGKLAHRLRDLPRAGHEEVLLRCVERHRRDVGGGDANDGPVEIVEGVLGDDRRDLRPKPA